jgi:SP family general alpha glucoside:H+ symporter-like MFS transporter
MDYNQGIDTRRPSVAVGVDLRKDIDDYDRVVQEARIATEEQTRMGLWEGLRRYPKACAWSMLLSTAIV